MTNNFEHLSKSEFEELKKIFYSQAYETLENIQDEALRLEAAPEDNAILKAIKRHVHTLKGDSNSFGLTDVGTLCHRIEDILSCIIDGQRNAAHEEIDLILSSADIINRLLQESESGEKVTDSKDIIERIDNFIQKNAQQEDLSQHPEFTEYQDLQIQAALKKGLIIYEVEIVFHPMCGEKTAAAFMVTKSLSDFGEIINTAPDIESGDINEADSMKIICSSNIGQEQIEKNAFITGITDKINVRAYRYLEKRLESDIKETGIKGQFLRVEVSKVDRLINLVGELIIGRSMIDQIARDIDGGRSTNDIAARILDVNSYMERTVSDLQYGIMKMRMVSVNHVFRKFPKIVRDLSDEKGKKVRLDIHGKETELDKGIVDALGEPLAHLIRNSIDHGIEEPEYRRSIGKPEEGVITLRAYHEAGHIIIEASDDGKGINIEKLKEKAVEKGFIDKDEVKRLSDAEAGNLIFLSGFSVLETVSETSGRGVGMDAVKVAVEALKGSITIESTPGKGTKFKFSLPLTLAVIKALLFEVGEKLYAIPISSIAEVAKLIVDDLVKVDGKDMLRLRDQIISIIHLKELFRINGNGGMKKFALILAIEGKKIGILVDRLWGQQELVMKAVDEECTQAGLVAGASILGSGKVVLILDTPAICRKAVEKEKKKAVQ